MDVYSDSLNDKGYDDILLVLDKSEANEWKQFTEDIDSCEGDKERYALCLRKRDELLTKKTLVEIEFAYYLPEFTKSSIYNESKESDEKWQEFTKTAASGLKSRARLMKELKKVAEFWGEEFIHHYAVARRGIYFAIQLAGAASKHRDWKTEALPRFQQLVRRRIQLAAKGRRRFLQPLEPTDLINTKLWTTNDPYSKLKDVDGEPLPLEPLRVEQLPNGYGFDQYGLLVLEDQAVKRSHHGLIAGAQETGVHMMQPTHARPSIETADELMRSDTDATAAFTTDRAGIVSTQNSVSRKGTPETDRTSVTDDLTVKTDGQATSHDSSSSMSAATPARTQLRRSLREPPKEDPIQFPVSQTLCDPPTISQWRSKAYGTTRRSSGAQHGPATSSARGGLDMERLKTLASRLPAAAANNSAVESPPAKDLGISRGASRTPVKRQRAASLPADPSHFHVPKRQHTSRPVPDSDARRGLGYAPGIDRGYDLGANEAYLAQAIFEMRQKAKGESTSRGTHTARNVLPILENCRHPVIDPKNGLLELHLLDGVKAKALLDETTPDVPVITEGQQHFQWNNPARPIPEFFEWMEDNGQSVSVQIPSLDMNQCSYESRTIQQVRKRFLSEEEPDDPWNVLDCRCPLPSTLPDFVTGRNCQLLARIRDKVLHGDSAERVVARRTEWAEWREIEHWALLSEGGHCTAAHTDSHGLATWITIQEGLFGFAWMARPTDEQRAAWMNNTEQYDDGQPWRYWVLKPGQTIFFPSGTIHCVFRVRKSQTLGLGGHILQWSGIRQWLDVVRQQVDVPDSTNEDMTDIGKWIPVMEDLLLTRLGRVTATD